MISTSISKSFLIRIASFISILGSGVVWTGLGYTLSALYNDSRFMGLMQVLAISTSLLGPYLAIFLQNKLDIRKTLIGPDVLSAVCYLAIFVLIFYNRETLSSPTPVIALAAISMLALAIQAIYFEPLYAEISSEESPSTDLTSQFSKLGSYTTLGKLIGMGCGPLFFELFAFKAIIINSLTFSISGILIALAITNSPSIQSITKRIKDNGSPRFKLIYCKLLTKFAFLENVIANSLIYVVVLVLSMRLMDAKASAIELSIYWFGATSSAFIVQTILSKESRFNTLLRRFDARFGYLALIPPLVGLICSSSVGIIASQLAFSFINPIARNTARARFYEAFGTAKSAIDAYGYRDFCSQIIIFVFSASVPFFHSTLIHVILCISIPLLVLSRWIFSRSPNLSLQNT